ncbi:hypothetical protein GCM10027090_14750 [Sinomonas soli]
MCHPAWAPARAPAPCPRELVRVRRLRDLIDRDDARRVRAAHDGARRLPLDVAAFALAACSGIPAAQLTREFTCAYGVSPEEYASAGALRRWASLGMSAASAASAERKCPALRSLPRPSAQGCDRSAGHMGGACGSGVCSG